MLVSMGIAAQDKSLLLMRHGKAEEGSGKPDHDRVLAKRGVRQGELAGAWLREQGLVPDLVICSTAVRTRQTWDAVRRGGARAEYVEYRRPVYQGGAESLIETIREDAGDSSIVLVVGHNPTMAEATAMLTDGDGSAQAHEALAAGGFVTSGIAVLRYSGEWADLELGTCRLERFHVCRD
jgi:phosphohistidine phosphatase